VQMFELQAMSKGLKFEYDISNAPVLVRADERRLMQILINLLGNAVKFTPSGRVSFRATHAREMAVFDIDDSGPGIAAPEIERIFEPFARGASAAAASGGDGAGSTGLGLTIAKMLTDLMGGEMTVSSRTDAAAAGGTGTRRRLLLTDNEEVDRTLLARRLEGLGFEVLQTASGEAALTLLKEIPVHAVLMDLAMPGIDGWETIRTLRRLNLSDAPVAIVSANAFDKGLDNDVGISAADFITKPVRFDELLDWLGDRLQLQWQATAPPPVLAPVMVASDAPRPSRAQLLALREVVQLGYPRGVQRVLADIASHSPQCAPWLAPLQALAQGFSFARMTQTIDDALVQHETK
jgi:CheY-like chemotaxis protein